MQSLSRQEHSKGALVQKCRQGPLMQKPEKSPVMQGSEKVLLPLGYEEMTPMKLGLGYNPAVAKTWSGPAEARAKDHPTAGAVIGAGAMVGGTR